MNITKRLFSRGTCMRLSKLDNKMTVCKTLDLPIPSDLPSELQSSLVYSEIAHFHSVIHNLKNGSKESHFEILSHPINLKQKVMVRSLLRRSKGFIDDSNNLELKSLERFFNSEFLSNFQNDLIKEKELAEGVVGEYMQMLEKLLDEVETEFQNESIRGERRLTYFQFIMNLLIFVSLFGMTYFVFDWEVCEPMAYLLFVGSNLILLILLLRFKKKDGNNFKILSKNFQDKHISQKYPLSYQKQSFSRFKYEYSELIQNLN